MIWSTNKLITPEEERNNRYYIENFSPEDNPENNYVAILSKYIPEEARVLDLGCATGRFSTVLLEKKCISIGVELDSTAAKYAMNTGAYLDVYIGDMTDAKSDIYTKLCNQKTFDVIIMTDILEHIVEPTDFIRMYYKLLKVGGKILVSVPNFANIKVAMDLLNNQIAYDDVGILDNTHIKWYTQISFVQWIKQLNDIYADVNLDCNYIGATIYENESSKYVMDNYPELYEILLNNENINSLQLLFLLVKQNLDTECKELEKLIHIEHTDIVDILGNALKGKTIEQKTQTFAQNERLYYEKKIAYLETKMEHERIEWNKCADQWKEAVDANERLEKDLKEARTGWNECADNWKAAVNANDVKQAEMDELNIKFEEKEEKFKEKINELYVRIDELEASLNPIMKRDMELQKENNKLREERK